MSAAATSSNTSFFSFGLDDGFISKSFEGLRYRNLPPALQALITGGSVTDVHWACLGPLPESWILSFKDSGGKDNLGWGSSIPQRLQNILSKTSPSPHLRAFLGPRDSFIAWSPSFVRWANLPASLDDSLQSWLTPSGWKSGPPRVATWGPEDSFFAMSEYGDVVYRVGNGDGEMWEIYKETVEEWKSEKGFAWSEVAYIALDSTMADQFIAIRNDGTWAGSIDDINEEALQAFALNFFARAKTKSKSKPAPGSHQPNGNTAANPTDTVPDAATQALYEEWSKATALKFASALAANGSKAKNPRKLQIRSQANPQKTGPTPSKPPTIPTVGAGKLLTSFPYLPTSITTCSLPLCAMTKGDPTSIRACKHDVERLLKASGLYSYEWLRQERLRWHPDRFGRLCDEEWREEGKRLAEEMFKIIDALVEEIGGGDGRRKGA